MPDSLDVLFIVSTLERAGPTNQLFNILQNLDNDVNPTVLTLSPEPDNTDLPRFQKSGYRVRSLSLSRIGSTIWGPLHVRREVTSIDPDVVHTQGIRADSLSALFLGKYPRIATVRNYPFDDYPKLYGGIRGRLMARHHLRMYRRLDHPVGCSKTIASLLEQHGIVADAIQNGVDSAEFHPPDDAVRSRLRDELGLNSDGPVGVSVGGLIPRKDPKTVIRGFLGSEVASDGLLVFLGDGPLREECERLAGTAENVRFEGRVENVDEYLKVADYFVSASRSEGLPNAVMEALSSGVPVCLSDIPQHREILEYNRDAGVVFDVGDEPMLATQLDSLVRTDDASRCAAARQLVEDHLNASRMAAQYQNLYYELSTDRRSKVN